MKRSEINQYIKEALKIFEDHKIHLPLWAHWSVEEWKDNKEQAEEVFATQLGWDITDFGGGAYEQRGLLLFTLRNGAPPLYEKPYAEKYMIVKENQETPLHYHYKKQEDIINRGGGVLVLELFGCDDHDRPLAQDLTVQIDGIQTLVAKGERVYLKNGQSITMPRGLYHRFYALQGDGYVLAGEVSSINDDDGDNRFYEDLGRFPTIEEDEAPLRLLVGDYNLL